MKVSQILSLMTAAALGLCVTTLYTKVVNKKPVEALKPITIYPYKERTSPVKMKCVLKNLEFAITISADNSKSPYYDYTLDTQGTLTKIGRVKQIGDTLYRINDGYLVTEDNLPILNTSTNSIDYFNGQSIPCTPM
jgi:hypothetical protein